jgi:hypothetical protein
MGIHFYLDAVPTMAGTVEVPAGRGAFRVNGMGALSRQTLPTDPVGVFALTLNNLVTGSAIQVESQSGVPLHNSTAGSTTVLVNLQAYAGGSPLNNLRIKVRKGSASPYYQPWETLTTAFPGSTSIFVSQISDE